MAANEVIIKVWQNVEGMIRIREDVVWQGSENMAESRRGQERMAGLRKSRKDMSEREEAT